MSLPEVLLWRELRKRPEGLKFRKQFPLDPYALDFACLEARLAIEVDGEAHDRGGRPRRDERRDVYLTEMGFRTMRVPAREVLKNLDGVVVGVVEACRENPPRNGEVAARSADEGVESPQHSTASEARPLHHRPAAGGPPPRSGEDFQ